MCVCVTNCGGVPPRKKIVMECLRAEEERERQKWRAKKKQTKKTKGVGGDEERVHCPKKKKKKRTLPHFLYGIGCICAQSKAGTRQFANKLTNKSRDYTDSR